MQAEPQARENDSALHLETEKGLVTPTNVAGARAFEPPAPVPRNTPPSRLEVIRTLFRNPLELWGEPSYTQPVIQAKFFGQLTTIVNHPGLIRHVLVDNAANYGMQPVRQLVLRPILRDGLLTAEGDTWKRSRKAMAPVFTPRHARGFANQMLDQSQKFADGMQTAAKAGRRSMSRRR